ncbi:MAG: hypothetical protein WAV51_00025 [Microgenomates group bacterium]
MKHIQKWIAILILLLSTGFALWLYRSEPTAKIDPNDNAFQYALIDRTNTVWEYATTTCHGNVLCHVSYLIDHWVPNWAEGYNLPNYYSHVPQILIVGSYRMLTTLHIIPTAISLFQYYHTTIYLLLCTIPLTLFLAFRLLNLSWLAAGLASFFALLISTDGLYGIDQTSFLWRGWGLSSQLFALIWFPLAVAAAIQYTTSKTQKKRNLFLSIGFLTATTAGHLGIGMMAWMAVAVIAFSPVVFLFFDKHSAKELFRQTVASAKQTMLLIIPTFVLLSYWIIPIVLQSDYHNTSVWDPIWKFNSFGVIEVVTKLVGGALFDFGRLPVMTLLIIIGICVTLITQKETNKQLQPLGILFFFFLVLFFGRTTWGGLIDLIPGMSDFHGHRFIVGLHLAGLFLAPIGIVWLIETIANTLAKLLRTKNSLLSIGIYWLIGLLVYFTLTPHIISYAKYNDTLIANGNSAYEEAKDDMDLLMTTLTKLQTTNAGRVYALRGSEGSNFQIASSPYYMQLSTYGMPTVLWLPETWSPNSDTEQFFIEENPVHYDLYNIRYVVAPPDKKPQDFWKKLRTTNHWTLYEVVTNGYIGVGYSPSVVGSQKTDFINLIHLWIQSSDPKNAIFPELQITKNIEGNTMLPHFQMTDPVTYQTPDNKLHSLFAEPPMYVDTTKKMEKPPMQMVSQTNNHDMVFTTTVEVTEPCPTCVILLKQTYHPNWRVTVNGKEAKLIEVFPSYVAVRVEQQGTYTVEFIYKPSNTKILLFVTGFVILAVGSVLILRKKRS